jgi:uncharacterized protein
VAVRVASVGFVSVKGTRFVVREAVELAASGPVGDREFCLVDAASGAVLRTIEHPRLLAVLATWDGRGLGLALPGRPAVVAEPELAASVVGEYWGRDAALRLVEGPWAAALREYLGREVALARIARPGAVVYGASVSIVTTSSLRALGERAGLAVDPGRFRATVVLDTRDAPAFVEDAWVGGRLTLGAAEVEVVSGVRRCGIIDLDPDTGVRGRPLLRVLTDWGHPAFGVDAVVTRPGPVAPGAPVRVL